MEEEEEEVVELAASRLISKPGREELLRWSWPRAEYVVVVVEAPPR